MKSEPQPRLDAVPEKIWIQLKLLAKGTETFDVPGNEPKDTGTDIDQNVSIHSGDTVLSNRDALPKYTGRIKENHEEASFQQVIFNVQDSVAAQVSSILAIAKAQYSKSRYVRIEGLRVLPALDDEDREGKIQDFVDSLVRREFIRKSDRRRTERFFSGQKVEKIRWLKGLSTLRELIVLLTEKNGNNPFASIRGKWKVVAENFTDNGSDFEPSQIRGANQESDVLRPLKVQLLHSIQLLRH